MPDEPFLLPICTTKARLARMLSALWLGGALIPIVDNDPDSGANIENENVKENPYDGYVQRYDHIIDVWQALTFINNPEDAYCYAPGIPEEGETCVDYAPSDGFISYAPNNPFLTPLLVPEGYLLPPWYNNPLIPLPGVLSTDAMVNFLSFPILANLGDLVAEGLPRFHFAFTGSGEVEVELVRIPQGGLALITVDGGGVGMFREVVDCSTVNLGNTLSLAGIFDIVIDGEGVETTTVEIRIADPGDHFVDVTFLPNIGTDILIGSGGGLRRISFCGDATPGEVIVPQFRFTMACGLESSNDGAIWTPVPGWETFAEACFTGATGATGATGLTGLTGATGATGAAGHGTYIRETTTGLMQSDVATFSPETLIYAYYRADATRRATAFLAQDNAARVVLYNAAAVQKLALGIVGAQNELDTRESLLLLRFGAGALNTRQMYFNTDGTIQIVNSALAAVAKFSVYMDRSTEHGVSFQGRTGLGDAFSVVDILSNNQSGAAGAQGLALKIRGVNDANYTLNAGIFSITRFGDMIHGHDRLTRQIGTGVTPKVTRDAMLESSQLVNESGANYQSQINFSPFQNGVATSPALRLQASTGGAPMIGFLGQPALVKQPLSGDAAGNALLFNLVAVLASYGLVDVTGVTLGVDCCAELESCKVYDFTVAQFNSDWNYIDANWLEGFGVGPDAVTGNLDLNITTTPDMVVTSIRISGTKTGVDGFDIHVYSNENTDIFTHGHSASTPWFDAISNFPNNSMSTLFVNITCDPDSPVAITEIEIRYETAGGAPSGGEVC